MVGTFRGEGPAFERVEPGSDRRNERFGRVTPWSQDDEVVKPNSWTKNGFSFWSLCIGKVVFFMSTYDT